MSLVLSVRTATGILVAGDSRSVSDYAIEAPGPKVYIRGRWVIGLSGDSDDWYAFLRGLTGEEPLDDPVWLAEHRAAFPNKVLRPINEAHDLRLIPSFRAIFANGEEHHYEVNTYGQIWPLTGWGVVGAAGARRVAAYLLSKKYREEMNASEACALAQWVIEEAASFDTSVAPPVYWATTDGLAVKKG